MKLAIVVPCYNEEAVLTETTRQLSAVLDGMVPAKVSQAVILYVNDGSKDATWPLIEKQARENAYVKGLKLAHNVGHQNALWAGLEWACDKCDAAISIDADLQDDVNAIPKMVDEYLDGKEIVYGVRNERKTDTFFKRTTALAFYKLMAGLGGEIVYNHADFRLMSARAVRCLMEYPERNLFLRGMVKGMGFETGMVYYDRLSRFAGESKYPLKKMLNFAIDGITSFSVKPLRIITNTGIVLILASLCMIVYALISYFSGHAIIGWASIMVSIWFVGGMLLLAVGIIGEYIGKIYKEVKRRPRYLIEKEA